MHRSIALLLFLISITSADDPYKNGSCVTSREGTCCFQSYQEIADVFDKTLGTSSHDCRDIYPVATCLEKKASGSCTLRYVKDGCMKTCEICIPGPAPECGTTTVAQSRIVGGKTALLGAWPWQVAIRIKGRYACGGALITPSWIVTAARCVERFQGSGNYTVLAGASNVMVVEPNWQKRKIIKIVIHPRYRLLYYDIALLKLEKPLILNSKVRTVCLPSSFDRVPVGTKCYMTGWGMKSWTAKPYLQLQQVQMPIVDEDICRKVNTKKAPILITPQMLCAGYGPDHDVIGCHSDNGSPLVCRYGNSKVFKLIGVASWGSQKCNSSEVYTVFSRISRYRRWIDSYLLEDKA